VEGCVRRRAADTPESQSARFPTLVPLGCKPIDRPFRLDAIPWPGGDGVGMFLDLSLNGLVPSLL
jgi:hypothetical protein